MVTLKIQLDCSTVHDTTLWANIYVRSHLGCGTDSVFIRFCKSHKYFKDAKAMQINRILKIRLIWHVKLNQSQNNRDLHQGILHLWSKFGGSSVNGWRVTLRTSSQWGKFWLWSQIWPWRSRSITPKTIGTLTKVFYTCDPNLVILARTGLELSRGQASDWHTDGQTEADNDNTRLPNWPRVKTSKLRVTGLCEGNSPVTGEFPAQRASNAENVSVWWNHHDTELPRQKIIHQWVSFSLGVTCLLHQSPRGGISDIMTDWFLSPKYLPPSLLGSW